jgi:hypothetical protein
MDTLDYIDRLQKYRELCNITHTACFIASHLGDAYEQLRGILHELSCSSSAKWRREWRQEVWSIAAAGHGW